MMHTLERYFIPNTRNQMTDEIAEGVLRVVIENGKKGLENPTDYDAMSEIMWAGSLSHNGLTGLEQKIFLYISSDMHLVQNMIRRMVQPFQLSGDPGQNMSIKTMKKDLSITQKKYGA